MKQGLALAAASLVGLGSAGTASAATLLADTVIAYFNSGANAAFPAPQTYGGIWPGSFPVEVPLSYATDGNANTFVSLRLCCTNRLRGFML